MELNGSLNKGLQLKLQTYKDISTLLNILYIY